MKKIFSTILLVISSSLFTYCDAQYTVLLNFNGTNGEYPGGDLIISSKTLYGMTSSGAAGGGCVFSIDTNGNNYKDIFPFTGANNTGQYPNGSLVRLGYKLFGMTEYGGHYNSGCVFSVDTGGNGYKTLYSFDSAKGSSPFGSLITSKGKLYGMTCYGGASNLGCVFSIDTNGDNYKKLLDFTGANGAYPFGSLLLVGKVLYGMTNEGGVPIHDGNIFSIDTDGNSYKDLLDFNGANGKGPQGNLIVSGSILYGMTAMGGAKDSGCIFSIDTDGSGYKDLTYLNNTKGFYPDGSLVLFGKSLYGMTSAGGEYSYGSIFSVDTNGIGFTKLLNFNGTDGEETWGSLIVSGNVLYGMTHSGGTNFDGVIFKIDTSAAASIDNLKTDTHYIKAYPNPSGGVFNLQIRNYELGMNTNVEVYNELGQQVYSNTFLIPNSQFVINLSSQPNGVYLYRVMDDNGGLIGEGKLVIER